LVSVFTESPDYAGLVAAQLLEAHREAGQAGQGLALLLAHYERHPSLDVFNVVFRELRGQQGHEKAWQFARQALQVHPSLLGLDRLLEAELGFQNAGQPTEQGPAGAAGVVAATTATAFGDTADLGLLRSIIHRHTRRLDRYSCSHCGFEARTFYWQCPACTSW